MCHDLTMTTSASPATPESRLMSSPRTTGRLLQRPGRSAVRFAIRRTGIPGRVVIGVSRGTCMGALRFATATKVTAVEASWASVGSTGSMKSLGSSGSILSIGSSGSILSIGSAGSILSISSVGSIASVASIGSIGGLKEVKAFHTDRAVAVIAGALLAAIAIVGVQSARRAQ
jgi:hypothetical protein